MSTDKVPQVQEVRYCLKTLRQQMATRQNNNNKKKMPPFGFNFSKAKGFMNGCSNSQGMERRHQEGKDTLQKAETKAEEHEKMEEMQKLMDHLKLENATLQNNLSAKEAELKELQGLKQTPSEEESEQLKRELATLKEKNHNLEDMLTSQQRKIRNLIEQVQTFHRMVEGRDGLIGELKERVSFLEAEKREMQDRIEYYLGNQFHKPSTPDYRSGLDYSKPMKSMPFIKVVDLNS